MGKKIILVLALVLFVTGSVFPQEKAKNTITVGGEFLLCYPMGVNIEYERVLINNFSITGDIGYFGLILMGMVYADVHPRWYPWSKTFFMDLGLGCADFIYLGGFGSYPVFTLSPKLGWKIALGESGWVITPSITANFIFGKNWPTSNIIPKIVLSVGYSF